ncbi:hypothetical protein OIV83_003502 [Microbotryomycetes sp. JL201]|nr:hypothetical protein OIV83_003502 [Microbotryomycetes sp. JL201]
MLSRAAARGVRAISQTRPVSSASATVKKTTWHPVARRTAPAATAPQPASRAAATSSSSTPAAPKAATATKPPSDDYDIPPELDAMVEGRATAPLGARAPQSAIAPAAASSPFPDTTSTFPSNDLEASTSIPMTTAAIEHNTESAIDWQTSYHGLATQPFSERQASILMRPLQPNEIEIKPDGLLYLPEILYRRILNQAFGPGGWGMVPRGEMTVTKSMVSREWGLVVGGRLVSIARGEQTFFDPSGLPTATEGCKSNALMRCCKDLGIASELWDPSFIRQFKVQHCVEAWTEHMTSKKKQKRWRKKGNKFEYPYKDASA